MKEKLKQGFPDNNRVGELFIVAFKTPASDYFENTNAEFGVYKGKYYWYLKDEGSMFPCEVLGWREKEEKTT